MKTYVVLALDTRKPKLDHTCPILLRIIHFDKAAAVRTGIYVKPDDWNSKARIIKPSYKGTESVARLNNLLQKRKTEAMDIIMKMDERKTLEAHTVLQLRDLIENKNTSASFFDYGDQLVAELMEAKRIGNAIAYRTLVSVLRKYQKGKPLTLQDITPAFLKQFEIQHLKKGKSYNGLAVYMRTIRAIYNQAIDAKLVDRDLYPFAQYSIKTEKTRKRAIPVESMRAIISLNLATDHPLFHTRNYFLLSYFLRGMPFVDLMHLKMKDLIDHRVVFNRQKTGKPYNIKITDEAQKIFDYYIKDKTKDDVIFPVIKRETELDQYHDVAWERGRYNKRLKKLAALCGIQETLTSYVSRHSFATRAKNLGIPIASISDMLGHENIKTTEVYLDTLPSDLLDDLHEQILQEPTISYHVKTTKLLPSETETGSAEEQPVRDSLV